MLRAVLFGCAAAIAGQALALPAGTQALWPTDGLAPYRPYRAVLLGDGWKPEPKAHRDEASSAYPPEVSCGNALCTADWTSPDGDHVSLILWMPDDDGGLVIAPSPFEINAAPF